MNRKPIYFRCCYANKATLIGYVGTLLSIISIFITALLLPHPAGVDFGEIYVIEGACLFAFFCTNAMTLFGTETLDAYKRTTYDLNRYGYDPKLVEYYRAYCSIVGARLALRDYQNAQKPVDS